MWSRSPTSFHREEKQTNVTTIDTIHRVHQPGVACSECLAPRSQDYDESLEVGRGILFGVTFSVLAWVVIAGFALAIWMGLR
jgi:hypothetical protein